MVPSPVEVLYSMEALKPLSQIVTTGSKAKVEEGYVTMFARRQTGEYW